MPDVKPTISGAKKAVAVAVVSAGVALSGFIGLTGKDTVKICDALSGKCVTMDAIEYQALKVDLGSKWEEDKPMTWEELKALSALIDHEIKADGGLAMTDVKSRADFKRRLIDKLYE